MKYPRLLLSLSLIALIATFSIARADSFDSDEATIQKKSDTAATVMVDKKTYVVPVCFGDGASWDNVRDHYELSDATKTCLASGKAKLSVGSDGGATWSKK